MNFYKIIKNGVVVDANFVFLRWQHKHRILIGCEAADAQFIQTYDGEEVYHVSWLNPYPPEAGEFQTVEAVEISEQEYLILRQMLDNGTTPTEPTPESEPEEVEEPTEEPTEAVMTVDEMRREIARLKDENNFLSECLLEMSEIVYA